MRDQEILARYVDLCRKGLEKEPRAVSHLTGAGAFERFVVDTFQLGYSDGTFGTLAAENEEARAAATKLGILAGSRERLRSRLTIPILDENRVIMNVAGVSVSPTAKRPVIALNDNGIFNQAFLRNAEELILTDNPVTALALIRNDQPTATFLLGSEGKYVSFVQEHAIKRVILTFDGAARLAAELAKNGVSVRRVRLDTEMLTRPDAKAVLHQLLSAPMGAEGNDDAVQEIEGGFVFRFPLLSYRVIGSFSDLGVTTMKASIKAFTEADVFVDSLDLYRNRDRQSFVYNLMGRFSLRDQVQLEADLTQIIQVIEKHRERQAASRKRTRVELADHQKDIGMRFLTSPRLMDEIDEDYSRMGYVRERRNKLLLYLVMTSRLTDGPLHGIIVSRSAAGKSQLVELTEELCPPEDVESISDLSAQALYYFGREDLKNKFIVIGELCDASHNSPHVTRPIM